MDNQLDYLQFMSLQENERTQLVNLSTNKLTVDERIKFQFKAKSGEFTTTALEVKLMNKRFCIEDIFEEVCNLIGNQDVNIHSIYQKEDGTQVEIEKTYRFDACDDYCHFTYFYDGQLQDEGYVVIDYSQWDRNKTNGFINIYTKLNLMKKEDALDIYLMFSEAITESIKFALLGSNLKQNKKEKEVDYDEWFEKMGISDLYKK